MHVPRSWWRACALLILPGVLALMSCSTSSPILYWATPTAQSSNPQGLPIPETATSCADVQEVAGGEFPELSNLNFPQDGIATGKITSPTSAPLQVALYDACFRLDRGFGTPTAMGTPMDEVIEALGVLEHGWATSKRFPAYGDALTACTAAQRCFTRNPQNYLKLEQVRANSHGLVEFFLRLTMPQPGVPCDPVVFPHYTYPQVAAPYGAAQIPLPPQTRVSSLSRTTEGYLEFFCSAGTAQQVNDYMQEHLPKTDWQKVTVNGRQYWTIQKGGNPRLYMRLAPITDPLKWSILEYFEGFTP